MTTEEKRGNIKICIVFQDLGIIIPSNTVQKSFKNTTAAATLRLTCTINWVQKIYLHGK